VYQLSSFQLVQRYSQLVHFACLVALRQCAVQCTTLGSHQGARKHHTSSMRKLVLYRLRRRSHHVC
jgi:hypothetical protein